MQYSETVVIRPVVCEIVHVRRYRCARHSDAHMWGHEPLPLDSDKRLPCAHRLKLPPSYQTLVTTCVRSRFNHVCKTIPQTSRGTASELLRAETPYFFSPQGSYCNTSHFSGLVRRPKRSTSPSPGTCLILRYRGLNLVQFPCYSSYILTRLTTDRILLTVL